MNWQTTLYFYSILLTCGLTALLAWYTWRQPALPGIRAFAWKVLSECLLALTEMLSILGGSPEQALFWYKLRFVFIAVIPVFWLIFALEYSGRKDSLSPRIIAGMFALPLMAQALIWIPPLQGWWVTREVGFTHSGFLWLAVTTTRIPNLGFIALAVYMLLLFLAGLWALLHSAWKGQKSYQAQVLFLSIGALIVMAAMLAPALNLTPQINFNPLIPSLGFGALLYALIIFKFNFPKQPDANNALQTQEKRLQFLLFFIFTLLASGIATINLLTYQNEKTRLRAQVESQLSSIADLKVNELQNWRKERLTDAELFYRNQSFSELVGEYLKEPQSAETQTELQAWMEKAQSAHDYDQIFLLDAQGRQRLSIPATPEAIPADLVTQASKSLKTDEIIFLDFHRHPNANSAHLSLLVPVFDEQNQPLGVLILHIDSNEFLYPLIQRWPVPSKSGEILLARRDGNYALYLNELRFANNSALNLRVPLENTGVPAVRAALGFEGITEGTDYRGAQVLAAVRAVPGSPWFLAAKMDTAEAYAPLQERLWQGVIFSILLALTSGAALILAWRQQQAHQYRSQIETLNALRTSEEKFKLAFETSPDSVSIVKLKDGRFISVNKGFEQISGYRREEVIGKTMLEVDLWKNAADRQKLVSRLVAEKKVENFEAAFLTRGGERYGLMSAAIVKFDGEPHILSVTHDITERKRSEEQIRKLSQAVTQSPASIIITDVTGKIEYINPKFSEVTGYSLEEVYGQTPRILKSGHTSPEEYKKLWDTITSGKVWQGEFLDKNKNGDTYWEYAIITPVLDSKGKIINFLAVKEDITLRKQTEDALRQSEEEYRSIFENSMDGIFRSLPSGQFITVNPTFARMLGYESPRELVETATDIASQIFVDSPRRSEFVQIMAEQGTVAGFEFQMKRKDGGVIWVKESARAICDEQGEILYYEGSAENITARKEAEENLQKAREFLQGIQDALSSHIAILDHEGNIIQVNAAWRNFGAQNGLRVPDSGIGLNYLAVCDAAQGPDSQEASTAAAAIREVLNGTKKRAWFEYPCHAPDEKRWYTARITSFENNGQKWIVLAHENITARKLAEENVRQRVTQLELLYENSLVLTQSLNPKEIAQKMIELLGKKLDWHHTAIRLINEQDNSLELVAFDLPGGDGSGEHTSEWRLSQLITHAGQGLSGWAIQQNKTLRLGDVTSDPHYVESFAGIRSGLYAPVKLGERILGVISLESEKPNAFSETDEQFITTLTNQAAIALENARLYGEISLQAEKLEQRVQQRTAEIESTRQRLELAVKTAGIGIWELDITENKEYWDDRLFALYGLSSETSVAQTQTWHNAVHPDDLKQQIKLIDATLQGSQPYDTEFRVVWPDGSIHYIKSTGTVIYDSAGKAERMIGANQDVTLHKQAEQTLLLSNAEMERGLRMKNEFLATMSHELRTPLNAILGISESLEEQVSGPLNEKQIGYIRTVIESGRHLLQLINDILDLSKIEAGKLELSIQTISVARLCEASLRMIKELAQKKSLNVSLQIDENVKFISGDERRLKQALVNLLGNAVKFTPPGKKIGLEVRGSAQTNQVTFTVWDEGIGIEQENIKYLFKPFVQLNAGLSREYAGTGLGLSLVAQMVRLHGGQIDLTSRLNVGSRFTITLPWMPAEQGIQPEIKDQALKNKSAPNIKHTGKILIVDDTEVVARLLGDYLRHQGYETFVAYDGRQGVMLAKRERPQIILMDVMMPEVNGLEATKQIRADAALRDILIIGLTALAMPSDRKKCLAAGMNDYVSKPIEMQELIKIIERHLSQSR